MKLAQLALLVPLALLVRPALAQTSWYVDAQATPPGSGTLEDPYASIQHALEQPSTLDGDTVWVLPGTYPEQIDLLGKDVVLTSTDGPAATVIDASLPFTLEQSAVKLRSGEGPGCVLSGFTILGGLGTAHVDPVFGVEFFVGGGLLVIGSSPTIRGCVIRDNDAQLGGGIYAEGASPTIEGCEVAGNRSSTFGAGFYLYQCQATLTGTTVRDNESTGNSGGGLYVLGGRLAVRGGLLEGNRSTGGGDGGHVALGLGGSLTMVDVLLREGLVSEGNGGAIWAETGDLDLVRCGFERNSVGHGSSNREGGAVHVTDGSLRIEDSVFADNTSARGGAVFLERSTASILGCRFLGNSIESTLNFVSAEGGALHATQSAVLVSDGHFQENAAVAGGPFLTGTAQGGAAWCDTPGLVIEDCSFLANRAHYDAGTDFTLTKTEPGAQGGAVFGPALVRRASFLENRAFSNPVTLIGRAEGGAVFGARVFGSSFVGNQVQGVGPVPDSGPAAEAARLACCFLEGNLPASLPPLGPRCTVVPCDAVDVPRRAADVR